MQLSCIPCFPLVSSMLWSTMQAEWIKRWCFEFLGNEIHRGSMELERPAVYEEIWYSTPKGYLRMKDSRHCFVYIQHLLMAQFYQSSNDFDGKRHEESRWNENIDLQNENISKTDCVGLHHFVILIIRTDCLKVNIKATKKKCILQFKQGLIVKGTVKDVHLNASILLSVPIS